MTFKEKYKAYLKQHKIMAQVLDIGQTVLMFAASAAVGAIFAVAKNAVKPVDYAEAFFTYYLTQNWKLAYESLDISETEFLTADMFAAAMSTSEIAGDFEPGDVKVVSKTHDKVLCTVTYEDAYTGENKEISVVLTRQEEKQYLVFSTWAVDPTTLLSKDTTVVAPSCATLLIDGVDASDYVVSETQSTKEYLIDTLFSGTHSVVCKTEGGGATHVLTEISESNLTVDAAASSDSRAYDTVLAAEIEGAAEDFSVSLYQAAFARSGYEALTSYISSDSVTQSLLADTYTTMWTALRNVSNNKLNSLSINSCNATISEYTSPDRAKLSVTMTVTFSATNNKVTPSVTFSDVETNTYEVWMVYENDTWVVDYFDITLFDYNSQA